MNGNETGRVTNDIGRVTPLWKGEYSPTTAYELNDIVITADKTVWWHKGLTITTGEAPAEGPTWGAVIDMTTFDEKVRQAIELAQEAVEAAQAAEEDVAIDVARAEAAAGSAETHAQNAQTSANSAGAYAQAAETAMDNAVAAKTAAQNAQSAAEAAKNAAQSAKDGAVAGQTAAEIARTGAETAQTAAETAKTGAETAQTAAETARTGAETALAATLEAKAAALEELAEDLADAVETLEEARVAEVETAEAAIEEKGSATLATIPADYSQLYDYSLLHVDEINGTVQSIVFAADGSVSKVEHRAIVGNGVVREDAFTFSDTQIVEARTLASGATLVLTTDLATLATTVVYTAAA